MIASCSQNFKRIKEINIKKTLKISKIKEKKETFKKHQAQIFIAFA